MHSTFFNPGTRMMRVKALPFMNRQMIHCNKLLRTTRLYSKIYEKKLTKKVMFMFGGLPLPLLGLSVTFSLMDVKGKYQLFSFGI